MRAPLSIGRLVEHHRSKPGAGKIGDPMNEAISAGA